MKYKYVLYDRAGYINESESYNTYEEAENEAVKICESIKESCKKENEDCDVNFSIKEVKENVSI